MTDRKPGHGLNNDPATDRRNADAPETFNDSQRREDEQAQSVAEDALALRKSAALSGKRTKRESD